MADGEVPVLSSKRNRWLLVLGICFVYMVLIASALAISIYFGTRAHETDDQTDATRASVLQGLVPSTPTAYCTVPFEYKGRTYSGCTTAGDAAADWCSLSRVYSGIWDYCVPPVDVSRRCVFPFTYNGVRYVTCARTTSRSLTRYWCSYASEYSGQWNYCIPMTVKPHADCLFPFVFRGFTYHNCTPATSIVGYWCGTADGGPDWEYCYDTSLATHPKCVLPFQYKGKTYEHCTLKDSEGYWCSAHAQYTGHYFSCKNRSNKYFLGKK